MGGRYSSDFGRVLELSVDATEMEVRVCVNINMNIIPNSAAYVRLDFNFSLSF